MLAYLTLIFACQLAGELAARAFGLPLPGPVLGMALLFLILLARGAAPPDLEKVADGLLRHLSLLFVPAGVGVLLHFRLISQDWAAIGAALLASTVATIAVTGLAMAWLNRSRGDGG